MPQKPVISIGSTIVTSGRICTRSEGECGAAYVLALVAMISGLILGLALLRSANGHFLGESSRKDKDAARYLAEAGIEYAAWQIDVNNVLLPYAADVALTPGSFHVSVVDDSARESGAALVECTGTAGGCTHTVKRVIDGMIELIMDNMQGTCSSNWSTGTMSPDKYGSNYRWRPTNNVTDEFVWRPNIPSPGDYEVFAWWCVGSNRANQAPYNIYYNGGSKTVKVNQQINGGMWNSLGTYNFAAGNTGTVRLSCWTSSGSVVIADAIKLIRRD